MGKKRKYTHDILVDAPDLVLEIERAKYGSPWCDVCQRPSVGTVSGYQHVTAEYPHGIDRELDPNGDHEISHHQWYDVPSHEPVDPL